MNPFPEQSAKNKESILDLLCEITHQDESFKERFSKWVDLICHDIDHRLKGAWWLKHLHYFSLDVGQDVIDITGEFARLLFIVHKSKLREVPLGELASLRADAVNENLNNAGEPVLYAVEAGRRIHFFPAPDKKVTLGMVYFRPPSVEILPDEFWHLVVVDGVLSRFYLHFDKDGLVGNPVHIHNRYKKAISDSKSNSAGAVSLMAENVARSLLRSKVVTNSTTGDSSSKQTPASLSGIGHLTIEVGQYILEVEE